MSFLPTQLVARFTIALLWLIASPALAQERLFVFRGGFDGALAELDTSESGLVPFAGLRNYVMRQKSLFCQVAGFCS